MKSKHNQRTKNHLGGYSIRLDLNEAQAKGVDGLLFGGLHGFSSAEVVTRILDEKLIAEICEKHRRR